MSCAVRRSRGRSASRMHPRASWHASIARTWTSIPIWRPHAGAARGSHEVLEVGLGFGTLLRAGRKGASYHGLDIAEGPVGMARERLRRAGQADADAQVLRGSALEVRTGDCSTGSTRSVAFIHGRPPRGGPRATACCGRAARSGDALQPPFAPQLVKVRLPAAVGRRRGNAEVTALYDANAAGEAAPHAEYVSRREVRRLFEPFAQVSIRARNMDETRFVKGSGCSAASIACSVWTSTSAPRMARWPNGWRRARGVNGALLPLPTGRWRAG